jgi:hypothetical protein
MIVPFGDLNLLLPTGKLLVRRTTRLGGQGLVIATVLKKAAATAKPSISNLFVVP